MLKKILYADSGANNAQDMLKQLLKLPSLSSSKLYILRVISPNTKEKETAAIEAAENKIKDLITDLKITPNLVETLVREGEKKITVLEVAEELNADLIIMGSRGLGKLQSILANSVSQYVFQLTGRSLLLIKDDIYVKRIKRVMVAIDKSPAAQYALDEAINLFQGYSDAEIYLTRVNPDLKANLEITADDIAANPILSRAAAKVKSRGIDCRCLLVGGRPAQQICGLASDYNIDFLVLGSPERRPSVAKNLPDLERLLGSSLSDYVRIKAECPVLLVRQEEK
ncbi:universal stress protein UspA-like protein [Xenococcus sp. PCC 7305]|uniref:universal stress protein n=1 Tax=Xenococcus sp. PCC 7305 TaxID=102125 RepID=UPI0002AC33F9|nr:universal stress protein [Xenococcus sp. PCC 7305]ELS00316.1 universal stress protein UspA-like protein [Xenococcus sp. PCC 7305]